VTKLYQIAIAVLLIALAVVGAWLYVDHLKGEVATAQSVSAMAVQQSTACAAALSEANNATDVAVAKFKDQQGMAQAAILASAKVKTDAGKSLAAWQKKYAEALKAPDCKALMEANVCPSLAGY
jgi:precorrin-3B methylase